MKLFGLVGYPLGHSYSAHFFKLKWAKEGLVDHDYSLYSLPDLGQLTGLLHNSHNWQGFNVTIPYKQAIIPLLDDISEEALEIGAVNTVKIIRSHGKIRLKGFNTDVAGIFKTLEETSIKGSALILGTGGASRAMQFCLKHKGIGFRIVSRTPSESGITYSMLNRKTMQEHPLIVNCTPVGTKGFDADLPLPWESIDPCHFLFDMTYNPPVTNFLKEGIKRGAVGINGYKMLIAQANKAWEIWNSG
ncbi:MAG: shikimate dehydrogenase [Bacteroidales bacterium]|nr:shikimate dehydrogenase [Bacteroidales bacterium]MDD3664825.1 shikimate dehydrogenase [Bacteroidales bacterium]